MKPAPLLFALAVVASCAIVNRGDTDDDCFDLDDVCPNLVCDTGHRVVDGCEICECVDDGCGDVGAPPPACPQPQLLNCAWTCGACDESFDCPAGFSCQFVSADPVPPGGGGAAPEPIFEGRCIDDGSTCEQDSDCKGGDVCTDGLCFPVSECDDANDCPGGVCDLRCESDPNCPQCDICLLVGTCRTQPCFFDDECINGVCVFATDDGGGGEPGGDPDDGGGDNGDPAPPQRPQGECFTAGSPCSSDAECPGALICTTGSGVCDPSPDCVPDEPCDSVCFGTCELP
jgi:hypothetical protein